MCCRQPSLVTATPSLKNDSSPWASNPLVNPLGLYLNCICLYRRLIARMDFEGADRGVTILEKEKAAYITSEVALAVTEGITEGSP